MPPSPTDTAGEDRFAVTVSLAVPAGHRQDEETVRAALEDWLRENGWRGQSMTVSLRRGSW